MFSLRAALKPGMVICQPRYVKFRFTPAFERMPLEVALRAPYARVDPIMYVPPALHPCGLGWHPEWTKAWQGWGPAYEPKWAPESRVKVIRGFRDASQVLSV
jgi:hypothetical protein